MATSFKERLHKGYAQSMELTGAPLVDEKSRYQRIKIFDTVANGRVMTLDDIVQITTRDEMRLCRNADTFAAAGARQGAPRDDRGRRRPLHRRRGAQAQRRERGRAGRHRRARGRALPRAFRRDQRAAPSRTSGSRSRSPTPSNISAGAKSKGRFDLIVADRPDPVGPGKALFGETFYDRVKARAEARRLRHLPDRRAVLPALGDHRGAEGAFRILPAIGPLSHRRAELHRRLHGAVLGGQGQAARHARRHQARAAPRSSSQSSRPTTTTRTSTPRAFALPEWIKRLEP